MSSTTSSKRSGRATAGIKSNAQTGGESGPKATRLNAPQDTSVLAQPGVEDKIEQMTYIAEVDAANSLAADTFLLEDSKLCDFVREVADGDMKDAGKRASSPNLRVTLVGLRNIIRLLQLRLKSSRDAVASARQSAENKHLALENLLYEVGHLEKQIAACRSFRSRADDIPLVPVEEFYTSAPASISRPAETRNDDHELFKARLSWELEQRKRLAEMLKSVEAEVDIVTARIESKKSLLEAIRPRLRSVIETSSGLDDILKLNSCQTGAMAPLSCPLKREQVEKAMLLPASLHAVYIKLKSLLDARGSEIGLKSVDIVPTCENAPMAAAAGNDVSSKPHELTVVTTVLSSGAVLRLVISCFPSLGEMLVAEAKLSLSDGGSSSVMAPLKVAALLENPQLLLANLVNRRKRSFTIPPSIRRRLPSALSTSATQTLNLAFPWLHTFAGALPFTADVRDQEGFLHAVVSADRLVTALVGRAASRVALSHVFSYLDSGLLPVESASANNSDCSLQFPSNLPESVRVTELSYMGQLDGTKTMTELAATNLVELASSDDGSVPRSRDVRGFYYRIKLEKSKLILMADVFLPVDYPNQWPMFFLSSAVKTGNIAELRVLLDQMESDVNAEVGRELLRMSAGMSGNNNNGQQETMLRLFASQVCQLAACWDAVVVAGSLTPLQRQPKQHLPQRRGRDRLTAWRFDSRKGYVFVEDEPLGAVSGNIAVSEIHWNNEDSSDDESAAESGDETTGCQNNHAEEWQSS